jgi:hypothetical protein
MRRILLYLLLIAFLCQSFFLTDAELTRFREGQNGGFIREQTALHDIANLKAANGFTRISSSNIRPCYHSLYSLRNPLGTVSLVSWTASSPGQNRRMSFPIRPEDWGFVVSQMPRSDG